MQTPTVSEGYLSSIKSKTFTVTDVISSKSTSGLKVHLILSAFQFRLQMCSIRTYEFKENMVVTAIKRFSSYL